MRLSVLAILLILFPCLSGCGGDGYERIALSGAASLDGNPIKSGGITAYPDPDASGNKGKQLPTARTAIVDGKFEFIGTSRPGAGTYIFEVTAYSASEEQNAAPSPDGEDESNANSDVYRKSLEIPAGGSTEFKIELTAADKSSE